MLLRRLGIRWAAPLLAAACMVAPALAGTPFEKALPQDCVAYVNIRNVADLHAKAAQLKALQLWHDPAMKPFVDGVMVEVKKLAAEFKSKSRIDVAEMCGLLSGQVAIAFQMPTQVGPDSPPSVFILADVKGHESEVAKLIEGFFAEGEKNGAVKRTVGEYTAIGPKDAKPRKMLAYKLEGNLLLMGNDTEGLSAFAKNLAGGASNSLAENERYRAFRGKVGEGDVEAFFDLNKLIAFATAQAKGAQAEGMKKMGLQALQAAGLSISLGKDDFEVSQQLVVMKSGPSEIFNLFSMPAKSIKPEAWAPANTQSYFSFNWDIDLLYQTVAKLVNENVPGGMDMVNQRTAGPDPDNPLFNMKKDLFDALGNRVSAISEMAAEKGMPVNKSAFVWEMRNGDRLAAVIEKVMGMAGGALPIQNKTIKGTKIYTFDAGAIMAAQNPNPDQPLPVGTIGFGVTKSQLYFATHVELLDKILQSDGGAGLGESSGYRRIAAKFPSQVSMISYTDAAASMQSLFALIKGGMFGTIAKQMSNDDAKPIADLFRAIDGKKLPEFDKIKSYLTASGGYGVMDDGGLHIHFFSLKQ